MAKKFKVEVKDQTAKMFMYGFIGDDENQYSSNDFAEQFNELTRENNLIEIRINCAGGSVFEGIAMFNMIRDSKVTVHCYIDGVAASMGSILAMAGSKIYMSRFGRLMLHRPMGTAEGDEDDMTEYHNLLKGLKADLAKIYSERSGLSIDDVMSKWMVKGINTWFTATEAMDAKLIDGIYDGPAISVSPQPTAKLKPAEMWAFYNALNYESNQNQKMKNIGKIVAILAMVNMTLPVDATEEQVVAQFELLVNMHKGILSDLQKEKSEKEALQAKLNVFEKNKVKDMIDGAINQGKFVEAQRANFTALAEGNFDSAKAVIDSMPVKKNLSSIPTDSATDDKRKDWTFDDYSVKDPKALKEMKESDPDKFKELLDAKIKK